MNFWQTLVIAVIVALLGAWTNKRIKALHIHINSRMSELLELTRRSSHAEGVKQEHERATKQARARKKR